VPLPGTIEPRPELYLYPVEVQPPPTTAPAAPAAPTEEKKGISTGTAVAIGLGALIIGALLFGKK
jgi:hypothetical protein